jgi:pyruvate/2-oxoglutarate dehydrogenase complex dihydrolipoamide dehydrogenase (E3) component
MNNDSVTTEKFDVVVLGSGEGGKYLAWTLSSAGKKTALIERRYIGGSCPNIACLPSKNFVHSAKVAQLAREASAFGLRPLDGSIDMQVVRQRKRDMVSGLVQMHEERFTQTGVDLIRGEGRFVGPKTLEVSVPGGKTRKLVAEHVIISTGSRAVLDAGPGVLETQPMTHVEALELDVVPEHLIVLGGGYIGLEFAQAYRRFGSQVTIVERSDRLLPREDKDVSQLLTELLAKEGIEILTQAELKEASGRSGEQVALSLQQNEKTLRISGSHLLVATGRLPNTEAIGLELAGVATTSRGFVQVNEHLETTAPRVFAVGDCAGSPQFTHIAFDDFRVVRDNILGKSRVTTGRLVPSCLFTDPELARVGLNETEAQRQGIKYRLFTLPMKAVLRTRTTGGTSGFLKALVAEHDDKILGFTAFGESGGEMVAPVQLAMSAGLPYTALRDSVFTHPTYAEGLVYLFSGKPTTPGEGTAAQTR